MKTLNLQEKNILFENNKNMRRLIHQDTIEDVREFFESGLYAELNQKNYFVKSKFCFKKKLVVHEKVKIIYPNEWSIYQLIKAAKLIIILTRISFKYGFILIDCHGTNLTFIGNDPIYLDLGSFKKNPKLTTKKPHIACLNEFMRSYIYPLEIWNKVDSKLWKLFLPRYGKVYEVSNFKKIINPLWRILSDNKINIIYKIIHAFIVYRNKIINQNYYISLISIVVSNILSFLFDIKYYENKLLKLEQSIKKDQIKFLQIKNYRLIDIEVRKIIPKNKKFIEIAFDKFFLHHLENSKLQVKINEEESEKIKENNRNYYLYSNIFIKSCNPFEDSIGRRFEEFKTIIITASAENKMINEIYRFEIILKIIIREFNVNRKKIYLLIVGKERNDLLKNYETSLKLISTNNLCKLYKVNLDEI